MCEATNVNENTSNNTNAQAPVPAPKKKHTFWKITGLVLGTVVSVGLGACGGYYYAKRSGAAASTEAFK